MPYTYNRDEAHQYEVFQLPVSHPSCFRGSPVPPIKEYKSVYQGEVFGDPQIFNSQMALLDVIYDMLNINQPEDYTGRSLTTSDVVKLDGVYYLCGYVGWRILKEDQISEI